MHIQLSTWEISNISNLINSIYETYGCNLEKSSCLTIGWISYLEYRNLYPYSLYSDDFIQYISEKISASFSNLRKDRSNRIRITSKYVEMLVNEKDLKKVICYLSLLMTLKLLLTSNNKKQ